MTAAGLLMLAGIVTVRFLRRKQWWLKCHRAAGSVGAGCLIIGFIAAMVMVSQSGTGHFAIPHTWMGMATVLFGVATPVMGHLQFKFRSQIRQLRTWHRRSGYMALGLIWLSIGSGLFVSGIM